MAAQARTSALRLPATCPALWLAAALACLGWLAVSIEFATSVPQYIAEGKSLAEALYLFFRYFTILTNIGVALLMTATTHRLGREHPLPPATYYAAALTYIVVVGTTYELLLRRLWSPHGVLFYTDIAMHDLVPALTLVFWLAYAPKTPLAPRDPLRWLAIPLLYFGATIVAGLYGQGYPYSFFDVDALGYEAVFRNALVFLVIFYGLGLGIVAVAGIQRTRAASVAATRSGQL